MYQLYNAKNIVKPAEKLRDICLSSISQTVNGYQLVRSGSEASFKFPSALCWYWSQEWKESAEAAVAGRRVCLFMVAVLVWRKLKVISAKPTLLHCVYSNSPWCSHSKKNSQGILQSIKGFLKTPFLWSGARCVLPMRHTTSKSSKAKYYVSQNN